MKPDMKKIDQAVLNEVLRLRALRLEVASQDIHQFPNQINICLKSGVYSGLSRTIGSLGGSYAFLGMTYARIEQDFDTARQMFKRVYAVRPLFAEALDRLARVPAAEREASRDKGLSAYQMLFYMTCAILGGERSGAQDAARLMLHELVIHRDFYVLESILAVLVMRDEPLARSFVEMKPNKAPAYQKLHPLGQAILNRDQVALDVALAERNTLFASFGTKRSGDAENGYGKFGHRVSFDSIGTAFCMLAIDYGMRMNIDSVFYPREIIDAGLC